MDPYFKKKVEYKFGKEHFVFDVAHTIFSSFDVDHGTDVLLRHMEVRSPERILDIGCGYGPIGIILARTNPGSKVIMVDKDLLAVRYSGINARQNGVEEQVEIRGSVALENVPEKDFDVIVSNVPAKIGDEAIEHDFILEPYSRLAPGGSYWIVVVVALNRLIPKLCRKHELHFKEVKKRTGHSVYRITKPGQ